MDARPACKAKRKGGQDPLAPLNRHSASYVGEASPDKHDRKRDALVSATRNLLAAFPSLLMPTGGPSGGLDAVGKLQNI
jgi:hypothetical protein